MVLSSFYYDAMKKGVRKFGDNISDPDEGYGEVQTLNSLWLNFMETERGLQRIRDKVRAQGILFIQNLNDKLPDKLVDVGVYIREGGMDEEYVQSPKKSRDVLMKCIFGIRQGMEKAFEKSGSNLEKEKKEFLKSLKIQAEIEQVHSNSARTTGKKNLIRVPLAVFNKIVGCDTVGDAAFQTNQKLGKILEGL